MAAELKTPRFRPTMHRKEPTHLRSQERIRQSLPFRLLPQSHSPSIEWPALKFGQAAPKQTPPMRLKVRLVEIDRTAECSSLASDPRRARHCRCQRRDCLLPPRRGAPFRLLSRTQHCGTGWTRSERQEKSRWSCDPGTLGYSTRMVRPFTICGVTVIRTSFFVPSASRSVL